MLMYPTGDDWPLEGTVTKADGTPLDLTAATLSVSVCDENGVQFGTTQTGVIVTAAAGTWSCVIPRAMTATAPVGYATVVLQIEQALLRQEFRLAPMIISRGVIS